MKSGENMARTEKSIINFIWAIIGQALGIGISFISRIFFIRILGSEYLGLNGLFTNILSVLSLAELGIGPAITYSLYKPIADNDTRQLKMLMQLYKKIYIIIGIVILSLGISLTPFLDLFIKEIPDITNLNLIYILFVLNTAISYFYSYRTNLIIANQKSYITTIYHYISLTILNIVQIIYLIITKNYIGYLILQIIATVIENILISKKAIKMYPYLKSKEKVPLDSSTKKSIIKNTKAMMMHKVGGVVVNSTDNILISTIIGLKEVGLYSNYYLIKTAVNKIIYQIYTSITASVGNLCASTGKNKQYEVFKSINLLTFWIYSFTSICLLNLFNPFIEIWLGKEYLFSKEIVFILVINYYISGMRKSVLTFREATGLFEKDKYKALIESLINIVASIILAKKLGIFGIFLGTFVSSVTTCAWVEPYILYKYGFNKKFSQYLNDYFKQVILTVIMASLTYLLCSIIKINLYLNLIIYGIISLIIPNVILYFIFSNTSEFKYLYDKVLIKVTNKIKKLLRLKQKKVLYD